MQGLGAAGRRIPASGRGLEEFSIGKSHITRGYPCLIPIHRS
jgi:hypothetical protein